MNLPSILPPNLIPTDLHAFIAGGYAACPDLASDCDVWVTVPKDTLVQTRGALLAHLMREGFSFCEEGGRDTHDVGDPQYDLNTVITDKVAIVAAYIQGRNVPIHLLVTDGNVDDVLEGFDISTHQCAITPKRDERLYTGNDWTPLDEEPYVIRWTEPTRARLDKIRARYAHLRKESNEAVI